MVTDPIGDFIIQIKNAAAVKKELICVPHSKLKLAVAEALQKKGYITSVNRKGKKVQKTLELALRYDKDNKSVIKGVRRVSKPSRRTYVGAKDIQPVKYGKGALILSTPKGILTDEEARKANVGGEALFKIW